MRNCRVGIDIQGGTDNGATGNDIYETARAGIILNGGDRRTLTRARNHALDNHTHRFGRLLKCCQPSVKISGVGNRIAHNLVYP